MTSPCPNKKQCGSCILSDTPYQQQLEKKLAEINQAFLKHKLNLTCSTITPSPQTAHYRNKMDFVINYQGLMGLRERGKWWKTIDNHKCFLADQRIEMLFDITYGWLQTCGISFYDRKKDIGLLRYAVMRTTSKDDSMLIIVTSLLSKEERPQVEEQLTQLYTLSKAETLIWAINPTKADISMGTELVIIGGPGYITESVNDIKFRVSPNSFFQTNLYTAELLQKQVLAFAGDLATKTVIDAYCGSGFFSLPLAKIAKKVIGVEELEQSIQDAKHNATQNEIYNIEFITSDFRNYYWQKHNPELMVLDPSRAGLHKNALKLLALNPVPEIIYVSCNFEKFALEMVELSKAYEVHDMVALDMFPHTPHVELVTKLGLK